MKLTEESEFHTGLPGLLFQGSLYGKIKRFATVFLQQQQQQQQQLYLSYISLHDTKKKYIYYIILYYIILYYMRRWKEYRLPIITNEGQKDMAALLRLLINDYTEGSGTTHAHTLLRTRNEKKKMK